MATKKNTGEKYSKEQLLDFYRTIGIGVKDKKALSKSTRLFVDYVRAWVAENEDM